MTSSVGGNTARSFRESLLAMLGLFFVVMMVALDQTVVGTALPTIVAELKGFDLYAWVATSYLLASVVTVPIFGRLGDHFGRKYFVLAAIIIFTLASALCGMASSMLFLVLARGLQGIGGGMLVGTAFASIPDLFPEPRERLRWQVLISSAFGIGNAVGPSLGGFLTEFTGWRSVFYVNLPVGMLGVYFVWKHMPLIRHHAHQAAMKLDWLGAFLIAASLGSLQMFVELLPGHGMSPGMILLLVASVAAFVALYFCEKHASNPILPFDMFRNPALASLFSLSVLMGFMMFALMFYMPLLLQGGFGLSPNEAGMLITPLVVCITIGSISNSRLLPHVPNPAHIMFTGFALLGLCSLGIATLKQGTPHALVIMYLIGSGLGLGFILPNLTIFTQEAAGRAHLGIATAMIQSLRMVGGMLGTALVGTLVNHMYVSRVNEVLQSMHASQWVTHLNDPQILINKEEQVRLLAQLHDAGLNGLSLLEMARVSLVSSIHVGQMLSVAVAVVAVLQLRRVPRLQLRR
ncbi:MAG TPA: MDR family MFS transporter [Noviherbaspirillum sp.]|uniref:MDR family MFS transporter n=1 Tax=Noviherbaspirillum sp. TaxID=1926288 RepID=UPI002B4757EA|nr:MDR family MFS transporter [Noviherbaspirillum sp.]HJV85276.1 MDR family MFS transporter [Noviherbaspirillum sp.]